MSSLSRAIAAAALLAAGCAGGDTTAQVRCDNACARDETCNLASSSPFCAADCPDRLLALRSEFRVAFLDCHAELPCNDEEISCEVQASELAPPRPVDDNFQAPCQALHADCDESFDSAFCFVSRYYEESAVVSAMDCLSMGCQAVESCLRLELPLSPFDA